MPAPHPESSNSEVWDAATARRYDADVADMFGPEVIDPAVEVLVALAGGRPALELGVGTGRIALPLSQRGVDVAGIELSPAMVDELRAKPGAERIDVTIGDMASTRVVGEFGLVYLVFNTIGNLLTQDAQVECFCNAAAHLVPGGHFVVEIGVPDLRRLPPGSTSVVFDVSPDHIGIDEYDTVTQRLVSHHTSIEGDSAEVSAGTFRYVWPSELDLMARIAGLEFESRWNDWQRNPFTERSESHVSVWTKPT